MKTISFRVVSLLVFSMSLPIFSMANSAGKISAPSGWSASGEGVITKGTSTVTVRGEQEIGDASVTEYMVSIRNTVPNNAELLTPDNAVKDGEYVIQVTRQVKVDGVEWHSNLMLCKKGLNKNQLVEILAQRSKVLDLISGAKYVINFCSL